MFVPISMKFMPIESWYVFFGMPCVWLNFDIPRESNGNFCRTCWFWFFQKNELVQPTTQPFFVMILKFEPKTL